MKCKQLPSIRGMAPIAQHEVARWQQIEHVLKNQLNQYCYSEIKLPIVEFSELFQKTLGEHTDIVTKEIYQFTDRNGDLLCLRPEGTASCIRVALEQSLLRQSTQKLWYMGPMFRHERPQKGRKRQFHQLGVEAFGINEPFIDIELLQINAMMWEKLNITDHLTLELNYIGCQETRRLFKIALKNYLKNYKDQLDPLEQQRLEHNPLRLLDSKNEATQVLLDKGPQLMDYLNEKEKNAFHEIMTTLKALKIAYQLNPKLVRGLDYYNGLVFEWTTQALGAQGTLSAGGRYDHLVEQLGGQSMPAAGFAMGLERVLTLCDHLEPNQKPHIFWASMGAEAKHKSLELAYHLRQNCPQLTIHLECQEASFNTQMKRAKKSQATWLFVLGDNELTQQNIQVKNIQTTNTQKTLSWQQLLLFCQTIGQETQGMIL